jgi:aminopeptidase N
MLFDETKAGEINKQRVAEVVAHELAHQWFGNLVTPKWWSSTWLSEGFATYFEYHATNQIEVGWKMDEQFMYEEFHTALKVDALESTHPLVAEADKPSTIGAMFDNISYNKGMLNFHLQPNMWKDCKIIC